MPRQKNTRPTSIYWLYDTRPETIAEFGPEGQPFYCGKSVRPTARLREHQRAAKRGNKLPVSVHIRECGELVRLDIIEIVANGDDWVSREKYHIAKLRRINPNCKNVADGGTGVPGFVPNEQQRANIGAATKARAQCPLYRAKMSIAHKGQKMSPENRVRVTAHFHAIRQTDEYKAKSSAATKAMWQDPEYRARMIANATGRKLSAEAREKVAASKRGKPLSEAHKAKVGEFNRGKTISPEHRAIMSATHRGKPKSEEQRAKMSVSAKAWRAARREVAQRA